MGYMVDYLNRWRTKRNLIFGKTTNVGFMIILQL